MPRLTRRRALATSVAALAGVSGCSRLQSGDGRTGTEIISARIDNNVPEPRTVSVVFERDGEVVYWREFQASAAKPEADVGGGADVPVESLTDEPAVWTVRALNHHTEQYASATYGTDVDPEVRVMVSIAKDDSLEFWRGT